MKDQENVKSSLRQMARDWSDQVGFILWFQKGAKERALCYTPLINRLKTLFKDPSKAKIVVPGCGLGRLAYEIAIEGTDLDSFHN